MQPLSLVIHGGAGTIIPEDMTPDLDLDEQNGQESTITELVDEREEEGQ
jgi:hypothetical protein